MKTGIELIVEERQRQISVEGWTSEHDDLHIDGQLSRAALAYEENNKALFPWDEEWWKPTTEIRNLVKAGALNMADIQRLIRRNNKIAEEIDRIQRLKQKSK
ncbi:MAG TPA: hypothetical protein VJ552_05475 [Sediminibacterium sp.]|nr:hypothetical protein [Sediminibacterium sp.]